jgi:tetratricopeptide (TPR) repeat protein
MLKDCRGVPVTCTDPALIDAFDRCHRSSLIFRGDPIGEIDAVLQGSPDFILGLIFKAGMLSQAMETRIYGELLTAVEKAEALAARANEREKGHIRALRAWVDGDFHGAVQAWEAVLVQQPFDLLALQLIHLTDVLLGDVVGQRDCVARVFPLWDETVPGYEFVLGYYAFGLEENGDYARAEEMGRRALAMLPDHPYAVHAVSHIMEMQGRQGGGIAFMRDRERDWSTSNFANHLWWHTALYHLDLARLDSVMDIYDNHLRCKDPSGERYEELDAAALLWRVTLLGEDTGQRWNELAEKWAPSAEDTLYAFNDVHAMMTFVAAGRHDLADRLLSANERYCEYANDANVAMSREIGMPFSRALCSFVREDYGKCVDELLPVRYRTHRLGGSFAQRDIIGWTLLEASLRDKRFDLALALANERLGLKPSSPQNWRFAARALNGKGDKGKADRCEARAVSLLAA